MLRRPWVSPLLELSLILALLMASIWWIIPFRPSLVRWWHILWGGSIGAVCVLLNLRRGEGLNASGLRVDNVTASAREVALATAVMAAATLLVGAVGGGFRPIRMARLIDLCATYAGWGLAQQYILQTLVLRRLQLAGLPAATAAAAAAVVFGLVHSPNWWLVGATASAGFVWCRLFFGTRIS